LGQKGAGPIYDPLRHMKYLEQFYVNDNDLGVAGTTTLLKAVRTGPFHMDTRFNNIMVLGIARNQLDEKIIPEIFKLFKFNPKFHALNMAHNKVLFRNPANCKDRGLWNQSSVGRNAEEVQ
jgi:hypothetical protein